MSDDSTHRHLLDGTPLPPFDEHSDNRELLAEMQPLLDELMTKCLAAGVPFVFALQYRGYDAPDEPNIHLRAGLFKGCHPHMTIASLVLDGRVAGVMLKDDDDEDGGGHLTKPQGPRGST